MGDVYGLEELEITLDKMANIDLKKPMQEAVEMVEAAAKANTPVHNGSLRSRIGSDVKADGEAVIGEVTADASYAAYVEFGTGPNGAQNHEGTSPNVDISYRSTPWYIPEDELPPDAIKDYHWNKFTTKDGKTFYISYGQAAQPFMYPAIKDNEDNIKALFKGEIEKL